MELTLDLCAKVAGRPAAVFEKHIASGAAWERFVALVEAQGGDATVLERMDDFHRAPEQATVLAPRDGVIRAVDAAAIGTASVVLGAGRMVASDVIDFAVGFSGIRKVGERVAKGEPLLTIHAREAEGLEIARRAAEEAVVLE
jgi:pyrimidine-nucleoside phosphorylase